MKVLFLDVDGVLNDKLTPVMDGWPLDSHKVFLIHRLLEATDAKVVLSSAWRHSELGVEKIKEALFPHELLDTTSRTSRELIRGEVIKEWLMAHPEVERYAILDDDDDMLNSQMPNFFQTSWEEGLTEEIATLVYAHLA